MPELPEVETLASHLRSLLVGVRIRSAEVLWPRCLVGQEAGSFGRLLSGRQIVDVCRRGKFLWLVLDCDWHLMIHLRMSGHVRVESTGIRQDAYLRMRLDLVDGRGLTLSDPRKFGRVYLTQQPACVTRHLGPEPLSAEFTLESFRERLSLRRGSLKPLLLNQDFLAGLGNIYVDEVLFAAGLHPLRKVQSLSTAEVCGLFGAIRRVLSEAIERRGTTLSDERYLDAEGRPGDNQNHLCVYQREGQPCQACGAVIQRLVVAGRGTHVCPVCQAT